MEGFLTTNLPFISDSQPEVEVMNSDAAVTYSEFTQGAFKSVLASALSTFCAPLQGQYKSVAQWLPDLDLLLLDRTMLAGRGDSLDKDERIFRALSFDSCSVF